MLAFDRIDTRLFRAFLAAAIEENFTQAALRAGMTQSGVSQHIAKLEAQVGVPLFERVNRRVLLTEVGSELKGFIEVYSDTLDAFVDRVNLKRAELQGPVRYAMPASCLKTPHFSELLRERSKFPKVDIQVTISANEEIFEKLVRGEIDFGFATQQSTNLAVAHEPFAKEQYTLVGNSRSLVKNIGAQSLLETPFINYPGMDVLLGYWKQTYFPKRKNFTVHNMKLRGEINHLDGAITMVLQGVGCAVFPHHCVESLIQSRRLFAFSDPGKQDPACDIFIVSRKNVALPARVRRVIETFRQMKS